MSFPPPSVAFIVPCYMIGTIAVCSRWTVKPVPVTRSSLSLVALRCIFLSAIVGTLFWSVRNLSHLKLCDDKGDLCMQFSGAVQFSTFTRWCWMLQGIYFAAANLHHFGILPSRLVQVLFGVSLASAFLVTTVTYGVLVPGALLLSHPAHKQGAIEILLSPSGHAMHLLNTVFMVSDMVLSKHTMQPADVIYGGAWQLLYAAFEWVFHYYTGAWHYPFLDYNLPYAAAIYGIIHLVFCGYWCLGCRISTTIHTSADKRA